MNAALNETDKRDWLSIYGLFSIPIAMQILAD